MKLALYIAIPLLLASCSMGRISKSKAENDLATVKPDGKWDP